MAVYEGNEKYIFISYAHKDSTVVLPVIEALQREGYRVWYDGGIEAGTEWPEYIADHLSACGVAIIFISENALASQNCIREINFAISEKREMLAVYLSDVTLSKGMKMQLGTLQALYRRRFLDDESFISALLEARILRPCKEGYVPEEDEVEEDDESDLSAFFGAAKQKKKARERATLEYAESIPIRIYKGAVTDEMQDSITESAGIINSTLSALKIKALVSSVDIGPRVTTYNLAVDRGARLTQLMKAAEELQLSLGTSELRILPPTNSRGVCIEILNTMQELILLEDIIKESRLREEMGIEMRSDTSVCLGREANGTPVFRDIATFPHLLISGITQTGKTTLLHSMIVSMITRVPSERLNLILVDLKGVEFDIYNDEPHMRLPVIHDSAAAARVLTELCEEMERRYKRFIETKTRTIEQYNEQAEDGPRMARIIFIVDDYTDLVYSYRKEIENAVMRLSQKARAAGIYVVLSSPRTAGDSVPPYIRANIPSRIAFKLLNQNDSRQLVDSPDAICLDGQGDTLFKHVQSSTATRVHTPYVSPDTVISIVKRLIKRCGKAEYDAGMLEIMNAQKETKPQAKPERGENEDLINEAAALAFQFGKISTSLIQRKLGIGYARALQLLERLEGLGVIAPYDPETRTQQLLMSEEEWKEKNKKDE